MLHIVGNLATYETEFVDGDISTTIEWSLSNTCDTIVHSDISARIDKLLQKSQSITSIPPRGVATNGTPLIVVCAGHNMSSLR